MTHVRSVRMTAAAILVLTAVVSACTPPAQFPASSASPGTDADRAELLALNDRLVKSQLIDRDSTFFSRVAVDEFRVLAPGGLIEDRDQAIAGLTAWDVKSVELTGTDVVFHGPVATVMGRLDIDGVMRPVGRWGPLKYMSTWIRDGGEWRLLSRSLTPCLTPLVEMGRC